MDEVTNANQKYKIQENETKFLTIFNFGDPNYDQFAHIYKFPYI